MTGQVPDSLQLATLKAAGEDLAGRTLATDREVRLAIELGNALVTAGWTEVALALARMVVDLRPGNLDGLDLITRVALERAAPDVALGAVERQLGRAPRNERLRRMHARLLLAAGQAAEAADIFGALTEQRSGDIPLRFQAARACVQAQEWTRAIAHLDVALPRQPKNLRGHLDRILAVERTLGPDAAIEVCEAAIAAHGPHPQLALRLGQLVAAAGRDEEAVRILSEARQAFPSAIGVAEAFGAVLRKTGDRAAARRLYDEALRAKPDLASGWLAMAAMAAEDDDLQEALDICDQGLAQAPGHHALRLQKADLCRRLGRLDEAMAQCRDALAARPEDIGARMKLGAVLVELDRFEEADALFLEVLERQPRHNAALLGRVTIAKRLGQPEAGIALLHERLAGPTSC